MCLAGSRTTGSRTMFGAAGDAGGRGDVLLGPMGAGVGRVVQVLGPAEASRGKRRRTKRLRGPLESAPGTARRRRWAKRWLRRTLVDWRTGDGWAASPGWSAVCGDPWQLRSGGSGKARRLVVSSGASLSNITGPEKARWFDGAANLVGGGGPKKVWYLRRSWSAAVGLKRPDISGERRKPVAVGSTMGPGQVRSQWGDGAGPRWSGRVSAGSRRCCCFGSRQRSVPLGGIFPVFIPLGTKRGTALQRVLAPDWPVAWSTRGAWRTASSW